MSICIGLHIGLICFPEFQNFFLESPEILQEGETNLAWFQTGVFFSSQKNKIKISAEEMALYKSEHEYKLWLCISWSGWKQKHGLFKSKP